MLKLLLQRSAPVGVDNLRLACWRKTSERQRGLRNALGLLYGGRNRSVNKEVVASVLHDTLASAPVEHETALATALHDMFHIS